MKIDENKLTQGYAESVYDEFIGIYFFDDYIINGKEFHPFVEIDIIPSDSSIINYEKGWNCGLFCPDYDESICWDISDALKKGIFSFVNNKFSKRIQDFELKEGNLIPKV